MKIPHWDKMPVDDQRAYVRGFFNTGDIKKASRQQLEDFLITMANAPRSSKQEEDREEQERFSIAIRHLIEMRINEELHGRTVLWAKVAVIISALAAAGTIWQAFNGN